MKLFISKIEIKIKIQAKLIQRNQLCQLGLIVSLKIKSVCCFKGFVCVTDFLVLMYICVCFQVGGGIEHVRIGKLDSNVFRLFFLLLCVFKIERSNRISMES